ncbi:MAG: aldehyde dehydrogenase family protein [Dermabacter sp.]|nr:aldehyde dehydrogenase family protein [Dermabacter sp.]
MSDTPGTETDLAADAPEAGDVIARDVRELRSAFTSGATRDIEARLRVLTQLQRGIEAESEALTRALAADLGKHAAEAAITEIGAVLSEIAHVKKHLAGWLAPRRFGIGAMLMPGRGTLVREPLGLALIISPWNYPVNLALSPLVGAIAGGNTAIVKPSEVAGATSRAIAHLLRTHVSADWVRVIEGGVEETTALLAERFDIIFYTGNSAVARIVAAAAAKHLTPTVLELGGKSPVFVDQGMDIPQVAKRLAWGKFTNAGQTCVAPDYVLATAPVIKELQRAIPREVAAMYGAHPKESPAYGRIINEKHVERIASLIDPEKVVSGGEVDEAARYIAPTLMSGVSLDDPVMQEEIFGPVLPLVEVSGPDEAIDIITAREKPLTLYVFTDDPDVEQAFVDKTSSGSVALGLTLAHLGSPHMPFGGVGESGMGAYHGRASVEVFTHLKPVVKKPLRPDTLQVVYPPYGKVTGLLTRVLGVGRGPC